MASSFFIHTEIIRFSFESDLRAPPFGAPVPVSTGHAAGVGGAQAPSASFQNGDRGSLAELEIFLQAAAAFPVARCKLVQRRVNFPAAVTATALDGVAVFVLGRCFFRARITDMIADGNFCARYALSVWSYRLPHRTQFFLCSRRAGRTVRLRPPFIRNSNTFCEILQV